MPIIAISMQKGGTSKSSTAINLGAALAQRGKTVMLVDLDPQAALTQALGIDTRKVAMTVYDVMVSTNNARMVTAGVDTSLPGLVVAPADLDLSGAEVELANVIGREYVLKEKLEGVDRHFHYVLIDCPPSLGLLTINALSAANSVLVPVQTQRLAYSGMETLFKAINMIRKRVNPQLDIAGILPTMYDARRSHDKEIINLLHQNYGEHLLNVVIPYRVAISDAVNSCQSVLEAFPSSDAADAYRKLAEVIDG